jgi:ribosomal-protein-alanine N-acetyltransferase
VIARPEDVTIRAGDPRDLPAVGALLAACPEAAQWLPASDPFLVAADGAGIAAVLVWRTVAPSEHEILNLATHPGRRRRGIAARLCESALSAGGTWFLEVRASNKGAQMLYESMGFRQTGRRPRYYQNPVEDAIVFALQRC